jgi:hypothetical protein
LSTALDKREVEMNGTTPTWSTLRELARVVVAPQHLKRTVPVALVVGTAFFAMNQLGVILDGRATGLVWLKAALTYLTPLLVSNFGVLSATRRAGVRTAPGAPDT